MNSYSVVAPHPRVFDPRKTYMRPIEQSPLSQAYAAIHALRMECRHVAKMGSRPMARRTPQRAAFASVYSRFAEAEAALAQAKGQPSKAPTAIRRARTLAEEAYALAITLSEGRRMSDSPPPDEDKPKGGVLQRALDALARGELTTQAPDPGGEHLEGGAREGPPSFTGTHLQTHGPTGGQAVSGTQPYTRDTAGCPAGAKAGLQASGLAPGHRGGDISKGAGSVLGGTPRLKKIEQVLCTHCGGDVTTLVSRANLAQGVPGGGRARRVVWSLAEGLWGRCTDQEIADELGCTVGAVWGHRKKYKIPAKYPHAGRLGPKPRYSWDDIDWTKSDAQLRRETGRSTSSIAQNRKKRGLPLGKSRDGGPKNV